jgi:hypothetical protein
VQVARLGKGESGWLMVIEQKRRLTAEDRQMEKNTDYRKK